MKIAMLGTRGLPATHGGVERAVEELSARLADLGNDLTVYCRTGYCAGRPGSWRGVKLKYLPAIPTKHLEAASHSFLAACAAALGPYDLVHIHSVGPALFAGIPRLAGKKVVVTVHALDWQRRKWGAAARAALKVGAWAAAKLPHATITVSRGSGRYLADHHGCEPVVIPNGVVPPAAAASPGARRAPSLVFLGRLVPEKRVDDLIAAFRTVERDATLRIAGDGYFSDRYVEELHRLASGDRRIQFTGGLYDEAKERLLDESTALVNPSDLEGHPIVVLEALSRGLPVLLSDIEEHREILEMDGSEDGRYLGELFRVGDRGDLVKGIERVTRMGLDEASRESRRRFVTRTYDWDRIAARTREVYAAC